MISYLSLLLFVWRQALENCGHITTSIKHIETLDSFRMIEWTLLIRLNIFCLFINMLRNRAPQGVW